MTIYVDDTGATFVGNAADFDLTLMLKACAARLTPSAVVLMDAGGITRRSPGWRPHRNPRRETQRAQRQARKITRRNRK